jgi:calcineurin-like phosphoesterase family protein
MPAQWFIGDLHFGHERVAGIRGFERSDSHDAAILNKWSKQVHRDDTVWVLGDISSGRAEAEERALWMLWTLPGHKHLIAGNHDSVSSIHRNGYKKFRQFLNVFESVQQFARVRIEGEDVLLSHYPYEVSGDGPGRGDARYLEYRLPDKGLRLIHAHTHHTDPYTGSLTGREFCVSWDAWRRLVNYGDVAKWFQSSKEEKE